MKTFIALCLTAALAAGCSKKEADPQPADPAVRADMTRTFTFPASSSSDAGLTYSQKSMRLFGQRDGNALVLAFDVPEGSDFISFTIPTAALSANLQGTYALRDRQNTAGAVVETQYAYTILKVPGATSSQLFFSNGNTMVGKVVITAYDSQRRLLAGSFEMAMDGVNDPRERNPATGTPRCNVKVTGKFENLQLE
ncbi:hypothetical protein [Hymenobacter ruricola]|uniref:Lipoprotein n=1 Tax=Hymenobacter ruricola TaxID=2791023 RepID=A0ABS0I8F0_9BACT|nr:hypothetical protein [Hymenobacter ruricola]MBF9223233.1 hypothetical protein [Hymenobacter ruricola]